MASTVYMTPIMHLTSKHLNCYACALNFPKHPGTRNNVIAVADWIRNGLKNGIKFEKSLLQILMAEISIAQHIDI